MDFLNDFIHKIDRTHGMYKTLEVIFDYFYPVLIILGIILFILVIRSYLHGKRIKNHGKRIENLEEGATGNFSQGASISLHCQTVNVLATTSAGRRILIDANNEPPKKELLPPCKKTWCPECGEAVKHVNQEFCRHCGERLTTDNHVSLTQSSQTTDTEQQVTSEYCTCDETSRSMRRFGSRYSCRNCHKPPLKELERRKREEAEKRRELERRKREEAEKPFAVIFIVAISIFILYVLFKFVFR